MSKQTVTLYTEDLTHAVRLADRFNICSGADARTRATKTLSKAISFMQSVSKPIADDAYIEMGNEWIDHHVVLDKNIAVKTARTVDSRDEIAGDSNVDFSADDIKKLGEIRKAFNLNSDKQAARLSIEIYGRFCDLLWRGNGFSMFDKNNQEQKSDTDKIKAGLSFRR